MSCLKAIVFDMDGVLLDTERLDIHIWNQVGERLGIGKAGYMCYRTIGMSRGLWQQTFKDEFGAAFDAESFLECYRMCLKEYYVSNSVPTKPGVNPLLQFLKDTGFKIALASSSQREDVLHHLENVGIIGFFDVILAGNMVERPKPDPEIYRKACALLGERPEKCYAVEDSPIGLQAAYAAGCYTVFIPDLWPGSEELQYTYSQKFSSLIQFQAYLQRYEKML